METRYWLSSGTTKRLAAGMTFAGLVLTLAALLASFSGASASHVAPIFVAGNPSCTDLGYSLGYKPQPEPPPSGTYTFPGTSETVTITSDGTYFDWTSTLGIDAVIVKGGPNANVYAYDPPAEEFSDTGLSSPINPNNSQPYAISHIEFCYDFNVDVEKTANTSFTRTFEWSIDKSVTPDSWDLFTGDSGTSKYTVAVTKTGFNDSDWAVSGEIWVENNTPFDATIESVSDQVSGVGAVVAVCPPLPTVLSPGDSLHCTYSTALPDGADRTNTATVLTSGLVGGGEAEADVIFGEPTTKVNDSVTVTDTNVAFSGDKVVSDNATWMYDVTFACDDDEGTHPNTAKVFGDRDVELDSASALVTVNCYELTVEKDADTSLKRTWEWTIEKTASHSALLLAPGQVSIPVTYWVDVNATSVDSDYAVSGGISISNPNPSRDASLTEVSDLVSPDIAAAVDCPSLTILAGGSLECTYSAELPDDADQTNTATATLQNFAYDKDGVGTPAGTTDFSGEADVSFADPDIEVIDEEIDVSDTNAGFLGTVSADQAPASFHYDLTFGPFVDPDDCGDTEFPNTASFITNDTGTTGEWSWNVTVNVACAFDGGCTLTQGYWKTHSEFGPAPYDDTWALLPDGADTPFFGTGYTYYEILWMEPKGGNAYLILAHQYIAAELNVLNGAEIPDDVLNAWLSAQDLLISYEGTSDIPKQARADRALALELYSILVDYNEGLTGPGHCTE